MRFGSDPVWQQKATNVKLNGMATLTIQHIQLWPLVLLKRSQALASSPCRHVKADQCRLEESV